MYRRPLISILDALFAIGAENLAEVVVLSDKARVELQLAAILAPLAMTNLRSEVLPCAYALDASPSAGAYTRTPLPLSVAEAFWRFGERKGGYSKLESLPRCLLRRKGALDPYAELAYSYPRRSASSLAFIMFLPLVTLLESFLPHVPLVVL